ncbi:MAG: PAS domain S-box protein [Parvularculaceae bacterium]
MPIAAYDASIFILGACAVLLGQLAYGRINRRRRAGQIPALSENTWQTIQILDSLYGFVGICTLDGDLIFASRAPIERLGLKEENILGKPFWESSAWAYSKDVQAQLRDAIRRARAGENVRYTVDNRAHDGSFITLDLTVTPLRDETGAVVKILAFATDITSQVAAEKARQEHEKLFREIAQTTPVPVVISDLATGEFKFYNDAAAALCREKLDFEITERKTLDIWGDPEDRKKYVEEIKRNGKVFRREVSVRGLDGKLRWLEAYATRINFLGQSCILTCLLDVDDRYRSEQALRNAKKSLDRAQRIAEMGSWEWNIISNELSWSDQIYRMFGYEVGEITPTYKAFLDHIHEEDRATVEAAIEQAVERRSPYDINHRIVLADGRVKVLHEQGEVEYDDDGHAVRMLGAVKDITAICRTEEALRRSQLTLSGILNISPEAMIVANEEGRITIFSAGAEAIFGYGAGEVIGRRVECLMPERFRRRHPELIGEFGEARTVSKQMGERQEILGRRKNGEEFPAKASLSKLETPDGVYFTTILRDVTAEKKHEAELTDARKKAEAASEAKSSFLATMSHELRTPLNGVLGAAQILSGHKLDDGAADWVGMIRDSGENLLALLNDILDICKIEEGKLIISDQELDLAQLFEGVIAPRRMLAGEKAVDLVLKTDFGGGRYRSDPKRIRQIVTNLVNNAIKFTDQGEITVSADVRETEAGPRLFCTVRDTGCGVPAALQARIFERFVQVEDGRSRSHNGVGLGLAICHELVNAMGGTIALESEMGRGSAFSFELPLKPAGAGKRADTVQRPPLPAAAASAARRIPSILIVDDQAVNRKVIGTFVRAFGMDAVEVESGADALARCRTDAFDLILMDIHMPKMCGMQTLAQLRQQPGVNAATPVVAVTADAMLGDREKYLDRGFDAYLPKPVNAVELKTMISRFVATKETGPDKIAV